MRLYTSLTLVLVSTMTSGAAKAKKEKVTKKKVPKTARAKWGTEEGEEEEAEVEEEEGEEEDADEVGDFDSDDDDQRGRREVKEEVDESPPATLIDYQKVILSTPFLLPNLLLRSLFTLLI